MGATTRMYAAYMWHTYKPHTSQSAVPTTRSTSVATMHLQQPSISTNVDNARFGQAGAPVITKSIIITTHAQVPYTFTLATRGKPSTPNALRSAALEKQAPWYQHQHRRPTLGVAASHEEHVYMAWCDILGTTMGRHTTRIVKSTQL